MPMFDSPPAPVSREARALQNRAYELAEVVRQARAHFPMFGRPSDHELKVIVANTAKRIPATRLSALTMPETAMVIAALKRG